MKKQPFFSCTSYIRTDGETALRSKRIQNYIFKSFKITILSSPHYKCTRAETMIGVFKKKIRILLENTYGLPIKLSKWKEFVLPVCAEINEGLPSYSLAKTFHKKLLIESLEPKFAARVISIKNLPIKTSFNIGEKVHLLYRSSQMKTLTFKFSTTMGRYIKKKKKKKKKK